MDGGREMPRGGQRKKRGKGRLRGRGLGRRKAGRGRSFSFSFLKSEKRGVGDGRRLLVVRRRTAWYLLFFSLLLYLSLIPIMGKSRTGVYILHLGERMSLKKERKQAQLYLLSLYNLYPFSLI